MLIKCELRFADLKVILEMVALHVERWGWKAV